MTYIEFFDKTDSENIAACLSHAPNRVIFVGDNSKLMKKRIACYQRIFAERGTQVEITYKTVSKSKLDDAVERLTEIVNENDECAFDITGGDELLNLALGIVYLQNPHKNIQIHRFNLKNNAVYDLDKDGKIIFRDVPMLNVEEHIRAYGGEVLYGGMNDLLTYCWQMDESFREDIRTMWDICRDEPHNWNVQVMIIRNIEATGTVSEDGLTTVTTWDALEQAMPGQKARGVKLPWVSSQILKYGLLERFDDKDAEKITITFKNPQVKKCLTKEGQLLELYIHAVSSGLRDKNGAAVYQDVMSGVVINWDNTPQEVSPDTLCDTRNEIDVMMMHGMVPVFISCKNGHVKDDELYKFYTVAQRFGGEYAQMALVISAKDGIIGSAEHFRQRAKDMDIRLIEDVQHMSHEELERRLKNLWSK